MPSMIMTITKDSVRNEPTFLIRVYNHVKEIGISVPVDSWECHEVIPDEGTMDYFDDKRLIEAMHERHNKGEDHDKTLKVPD